MSWILLHLLLDGSQAFIRQDQIVALVPNKKGCNIIYTTGSNNDVTESCEAIIKMLGDGK